MTQYDNISSARSLIAILRRIGLWRSWEKTQPKAAHGHNLWPYFFEHYYRYVLHVPLTFTFIALTYVAIFSSDTLEQAGDVIFLSITETTLVVKLCTIWRQREEAWQYLHEVANGEDYALRPGLERQMWAREQGKFARVSKSYIYLSLFVVFMACASAAFSDNCTLPYTYWVPYELCRAPHSYWLAYFYEVFAMPLTCVANVTLDMLNCYFMFHLAMLYKLLGQRLSALGQTEEQAVWQELRGICRLHQSITRLTRQCETLVAPPILSEIILSAFILCFTGYRLQQMRIAENVAQFLMLILYLFAMAYEIYLPCYYANEVTVNSGELLTNIYSCDWLQFSVRTRRFLITYMERLKHPAKIRLADFFDVGLPIFTKTMNNAYTFFTLLLSMDEE